MRHSVDDCAVEDRHAEHRNHNLHKVGIPQHSCWGLDHVPRCSMALQPGAQNRLGYQQAILYVDVEHAVDGGCCLEYVIIWDIHRVIPVLVLILPSCRLCEAIDQKPLCAFVDFNMDTVAA